MLDTANAIPIKMIRVVRVLNLSKFMKELSAMQRMVTCLSYCVIPMANAFVLLLILTIIYAVLGAQLFQHKAPEFFGDFEASLFTLFQVLSGDSWASQIARDMMEDDQGRSLMKPGLALFFISYFILANIVLLNVVVAVLLDEFVANVVRLCAQLARDLSTSLYLSVSVSVSLSLSARAHTHTHTHSLSLSLSVSLPLSSLFLHTPI